MIGVVVWSSESREKAIIWCEDQATLAYLQGRVNFVGSNRWPEPGDLVELESRMIGNLRHALNVTILSEQILPELPRILADSQPVNRPSLRIVSQRDDVPSASETRSVSSGPSHMQQCDDGYMPPCKGAAI